MNVKYEFCDKSNVCSSGAGHAESKNGDGNGNKVNLKMNSYDVKT